MEKDNFGMSEKMSFGIDKGINHGFKVESPLEYYPFEVKEILEKAHALVCQYINEKNAGVKLTHVKGTLKLVKMPENN